MTERSVYDDGNNYQEGSRCVVRYCILGVFILLIPNTYVSDMPLSFQLLHNIFSWLAHLDYQYIDIDYRTKSKTSNHDGSCHNNNYIDCIVVDVRIWRPSCYGRYCGSICIQQRRRSICQSVLYQK